MLCGLDVTRNKKVVKLITHYLINLEQISLTKRYEKPNIIMNKIETKICIKLWSMLCLYLFFSHMKLLPRTLCIRKKGNARYALKQKSGQAELYVHDTMNQKLPTKVNQTGTKTSVLASFLNNYCVKEKIKMIMADCSKIGTTT